MIINKCPLCGNQKVKYLTSVIDRVLDKQMLVAFFICKHCGLVYQVDRMSDGEMADYYAREYRETIQGTGAITQRVIKEQSVRGNILLDLIAPVIGEPKSILDIGSSTGLWLQMLYAKYGSKIQGVEPHEGFRQQAGVPTAKDINALEPYPVDLITIIHTLEHLADPYALLDHLRDYWVSGGTKLLVEVPDLYNEAVCRLSHPVIFNKKTLFEMLRYAGWEPVWFKHYKGIKATKANLLVLCEPGEPNSDVKRVPWWWVKARYEYGQRRLMR